MTTFRPERFVLSSVMARELSAECLHVAAIEVYADGTAKLVIEPDEPVCAECGEPATCFGLYEDPEGTPAYACNTCCGHGNEDGWCRPVGEGWELGLE